MFNNQIIAGAAGQGGSFYGYSIDQSLRFNDNDSANLSRTPSSASNRRTYTFSVWIKLNPAATNYPPLFSAGTSAPDTVIRLDNTNKLQVVLENGGGGGSLLITNAQLRDSSSWYHIVCTIDTTNSTADDRIKIYINGTEQTSYSSRTNPSLNLDTNVNNTVLHRLGLQRYGSYWDGYMAEVNFIDGTALDPTSFGETKNGVWVPKAYDTADGAYGTNGFYLSFADSAAIGDDLSGNTNDWTVNNLVASDVVSDSPTNNFATLNYLSQSTTANWTLSEGNLHCAAPSSSGWQSVRGTHGVSSGKWYWEVEFDAGTMTEIFCGIMNQNTVPHATSDFDDTTGVVLFYNHVGGEIRYNNTLTDNNYGTLVAGDILGVALNMDDKQLSFYKNGSAIVTNFDIDITGITTVVPAAASDGFSVVLKFNFGQDSANVSSANSDENGIGTFEYAVPSGFLALCSANLPEPAIGPNSATQSDDYFNTVLYTGDGTAIGSGGQAITGVGFQSDWTWIKRRDAAGSHSWYDAVRGAEKLLQSEKTDAEVTLTEGLSSFDSDGFTVGNHVNHNNSSATYAAWNWKAGGTAVSNTSGSITSSVSANQDAGFSIVGYTGTGANATIGHGLASAPEMFICRNRTNARDWLVYHKDIGYTKDIFLNLTNAERSQDVYQQQAPDNSLIYLETQDRINESGSNHIMYCFHSSDVCKVGKYVGNGNANGTFVYTGFRPAWVMVKGAGNAYSWYIHDSTRDTFNHTDAELAANSAGAEYSAEGAGGGERSDFLSNGFKVRTSNVGWNQSGITFIYLAFAEAPFKYANAR